MSRNRGGHVLSRMHLNENRSRPRCEAGVCWILHIRLSVAGSEDGAKEKDSEVVENAGFGTPRPVKKTRRDNRG